jgi:mRNA-degrading endonuclease toxin of MazEF toxin-antitoxin module
MSQLIRMDRTGHTTVAEWTTEDPASVEAAVAAFRAELDQGYFAVVSQGEGHAEQVRVLPLDAPVVILRRQIAGG